MTPRTKINSWRFWGTSDAERPGLNPGFTRHSVQRVLSSPRSYNLPSARENLTVNADATPTSDMQQTGERATGTRRGTLAALLAGSALGLAAMSGTPQVEAAKGKKGKKGKKNKGGKGGKGKGVGDALPSVRMVETTTVFDGDGVANALSKCPDDYVPINGGFFSSVPNPVLLTSTPRLDENAWLIEIDGAQQDHQITVTAVCLAATVVVDEAAESRRGKRGRRNRKK